MNVINSAIFTILKRFPDRTNVIKGLFGVSIDFRTLCEDFCQCRKALAYWRWSTKKTAPARRQEYEALQRELENEIVRFLDEAAGRFPFNVSS